MGTGITLSEQGTLLVPDDPIIPVIAGDGVGPDIWNASRPVFETAVAKAYGGKRQICWLPVRAGEDCWKETGEFVPDETMEAITKYRVALKGPLSTPVGKGFRSVNVLLRRLFDLYACIRPCSHIPGVPSPVKDPDAVNMVIFRENTE
ncbi:MAG: isocitrate/isopropylmalate family dehydrogenase, partial [Desulfovibrionaceae bacterium]|nr:isocitrate/isopropylmalate family dehydrogenase [Desulfovibrionaceae bacterium]